eukprot:7388122-Prymnesium_polylepis.1
MGRHVHEQCRTGFPWVLSCPQDPWGCCGRFSAACTVLGRRSISETAVCRNYSASRETRKRACLTCFVEAFAGWESTQHSHHTD